MSKIRINTIHILLAALVMGATAAFAQQVVEDINFDWRFAKGDQRAAIAPEYDDSGWESINLPHDWAISGPFGALTDPGNQGKTALEGGRMVPQAVLVTQIGRGETASFHFRWRDVGPRRFT